MNGEGGEPSLRVPRPAAARGRRRCLAALAGGALSGCDFSLEQGLWNPCRAALPSHLAGSALVRAAWQGIDAQQVWDSHAHLVGTGDSGSGIVVHPRMESLLSPAQFARRLFFLNAGCAHDAPGRIDQSYVERLHNLIDGLRPGVKLLLFAFDRAYAENGRPDAERTSFYVPDRYAEELARTHPRYFEWAASIHPYRPDCVVALEWAAAHGARAVKWLPAAMGMDPGSRLCDRFYAALARLGVPLICHAGEERAVLGADAQHLGNPLRLRRALEHGVRVVVAHCSSMGQDRDLDRGANGAWVESFALFARMMDEPRHVGRLFGDISAMTQLNRAGPALTRVIEREDWHARLLNGSDYPLPGVMPIFSVEALVSIGLLPEAAAPLLKEIRTYNVLLFDFVLKRSLRSNGRRLAPGIFETRRFFERLSA